MNKGPWHQCGDRSQRLVREQLEHGAGVGVIISPRDLTIDRAVEYSAEYRQLGAEVLFDPQYHYPSFRNSRLDSYSVSAHRESLSSLAQITDGELAGLASGLAEDNKRIGSDGIIAPAVVYEAARPDILDLNERLFFAGRAAADDLDLPLYASIMLGRSATANRGPLNDVLSRATALPADGWYFGFQFDGERIPSSTDDVVRCGEAILALACTGLPVLHAYAGPLGIVSFAMGALGAGIGHFQNLWQFGPQRWQRTAGPGGGGDAPPRFFSTSLWGTIIYPDELTQLSQPLMRKVVTPSPFSGPVGQPGALPWGRWDASKHLVYSICETLSRISSNANARKCAQASTGFLSTATGLLGQISGEVVQLRDDSGSYQGHWNTAINTVLNDNSDDYEYLELVT